MSMTKEELKKVISDESEKLQVLGQLLVDGEQRSAKGLSEADVQSQFDEVKASADEAKRKLKVLETVADYTGSSDQRSLSMTGGANPFVGGGVEVPQGPTAMNMEIQELAKLVKGEMRAATLLPNEYKINQIDPMTGLPALDPHSLLAQVRRRPIRYSSEQFTAVSMTHSGFSAGTEGGSHVQPSTAIQFAAKNATPSKEFVWGALSKELTLRDPNINNILVRDFDMSREILADVNVANALVGATGTQDVAAAFDWKELVKLPGKLPYRRRRGAYVVDYSVWDELHTATDTTGRPIISWDSGLPMLKGSTIIPAQLQPIGTPGNVTAVYGSLFETVEHGTSTYYVEQSTDFLFDQDAIATRGTFYHATIVTFPQLLGRLVEV